MAVDARKRELTLSSETGAFDARGHAKDAEQGVMDAGAVVIEHTNQHLIGVTSGVITLTSCTADEGSSVELALDGCGPHALALLEDPDSAPGRVVAGKALALPVSLSLCLSLCLFSVCLPVSLPVSLSSPNETLWVAAGKASKLKQIVQKFDLNNDNCVTLDEFLRAVVTVPELKMVSPSLSLSLSLSLCPPHPHPHPPLSPPPPFPLSLFVCLHSPAPLSFTGSLLLPPLCVALRLGITSNGRKSSKRMTQTIVAKSTEKSWN